MSEYDERKIAAINSLNVEDYECSGGECEYVLAADTPENRKMLLDAGFTEEQVNDPNLRYGWDDVFDVAPLAFGLAGAGWYSRREGFRRRLTPPASAT